METWNRTILNVDGTHVEIKTNSESGESIIISPPGVSSLFSQGGKLRKMWGEYAGLTFSEFLFKMFPKVGP